MIGVLADIGRSDRLSLVLGATAELAIITVVGIRIAALGARTVNVSSHFSHDRRLCSHIPRQDAIIRHGRPALNSRHICIGARRVDAVGAAAGAGTAADKGIEVVAHAQVLTGTDDGGSGITAHPAADIGIEDAGAPAGEQGGGGYVCRCRCRCGCGRKCLARQRLGFYRSGPGECPCVAGEQPEQREQREEEEEEPPPGTSHVGSVWRAERLS